jgi:GNAT superfamily N-acetyltransferase
MPADEISVRLLREDELPAADRIVRLAFGTFLGLPDPLSFMGDAGFVHCRWRADPSAGFAAEVNGALVGTAFVTQWGSAGFFGPVAVLPDYWDAGVAQHLLRSIMARFAAWGVSHAGLFTFPHSPKHIHLYQKFDFWPRFLTPIMTKPVAPAQGTLRWSAYSAVADGERAAQLAACRTVTDALYPGLDLSGEITAVLTQALGDTVLLWDQNRLAGFAVCHYGPGTEAGSGTCYIKFGAVRPGPGDGVAFAALISAGEALAAERGLTRLVAGVNTSHHEAYRAMLVAGFRTDREGVVMQRGNEPGYHRPGLYVIDDWR